MYFENLNVQQGLITGFEAGFGVQRQHYKIDISHSQIRGYNKTDGQPLANIPADKWLLKLKGSIPNNNFTGSWRTLLVSKQDRIPFDSGIEKTPGYIVMIYQVAGKYQKFDGRSRVKIWYRQYCRQALSQTSFST